MIIGLDSNFMAYFLGVDRAKGDAAKVKQAQALYVPLAAVAALHVPAQAFGELYNVLVKSGRDRDEAVEAVRSIARTVEVLATTELILTHALDLAVAHRLQIWDAIIVHACAAAGCTLLLSEDMQDGFTWRAMTVTNPFIDEGRARLRRVGGLQDLAS